ncbi:MFS transporter [Georgenia sp. TF02-10]|uniref:MFS transporter n=1 Tax=Georgenia sp. TF02-10 TaxID=2917725 RepID=UPI001FA79702|nr:MFS transporter [Georgenia sp. TF02-10]UNX53624.1 MFS transporter [Georgenia sp. TF02-10]
MTSGRRAADLGVPLLCAVQFVDVLGVTSATTAIPAMVAELAAGPAVVVALATAYAAIFGGFLVVGSRLGDRYGSRRVLLLGLVLFAGVSVLGGTAATAVQLVAARALQGLAAAVSIPSALSLLLHLTPDPRRRTTAIAAWSAAGAAAGAAGFLLGGLLTDGWSWRAIFWINVPVGLALAVLIAWLVAPVRATAPTARLDGAGSVLLVSAVVALVAGAALCERSATRPAGVAVVLLGAALVAVFVAHQRRATDPLVPARAARVPTLRAGAGLSFVNTATTSASSVLLTLHLQERLGASPTEAGLRLLPLSLAVVAGSAVARPLTRRLTAADVAGVGLLAVAAANGSLALLHDSRPAVSAGVVLMGIGLGIVSVAATRIGTTVPEPLASTASGIVNAAAQVGTALGTAAFLMVAALPGSAGTGAALAWAAIAALALATAAGCRRLGPLA